MNLMKNPWLTLVLGVMLGLAVGYMLAERQTVPPVRAPQGQGQGALPAGHPPVQPGQQAPGGGAAALNPQVAAQAADLQQMLQQQPDDPVILAALGNLYFDSQQWPQAERWYRRALEVEPGNPDITTDLAVVYRYTGQPEQSLGLLDRVLERDPEHWQAMYNRVVVLNFDLHRHDEAAAAFAQLKQLRERNPQIPDLGPLEREMAGH